MHAMHQLREPFRLAGFLAPILAPQYFVAAQVSSSPPNKLSDNTLVVVLQLGNIYLLLGLLGVAVLYATTEPKVVRNYLIALWLGDIGHLVSANGLRCWSALTLLRR